MENGVLINVDSEFDLANIQVTELSCCLPCSR